MTWFELFYASLTLVLGASIGSFINVVVYRLPEGRSLIKPKSYCPNCYTSLAVEDNIPIFGWLMLQGQCRYCKSPIHVQYPLVELLSAFLFGLAFWMFGFSGTTIGAFVFIFWLLALALIDLEHMILPNSLTQWGLISGLVFQGVMGAIAEGSSTGFFSNVLEFLWAAVIGLLLFDAIRIVGSLILRQDAMGGGDAKLAALIGAWLGWKLLLLSAFVACLFGSVVGLGGIALGLLGRRQPIPFGPYLVVGAIVAFFAGQPILSWYLNLLGL
ncbi:MAG: prepilin peptidase [Cyanobacteria bacterium P01_F01_bin.42]